MGIPFRSWVLSLLGASALSGTEEFPGVQNGVSVALTPANIATYMLTTGLPVYTITGSGTISFAGTPITGQRALVSNGTAANVGGVVATGGAVTMPVYYDGSGWKYG